MSPNSTSTGSTPLLIVEYHDPIEQFNGWLVIDGLSHPLSAGGMRVQIGLTRDHVINMAKNMSLKMRVCKLPITGAKCGIDYDPSAPGKRNAMKKFMAAIKPYITSCYSMGPDLNTTMEELESIARKLEIPSVKIAIAQVQHMDPTCFSKRYAILQEPAIDSWPLGKVRAGFGVAMAALATLQHLGILAHDGRVAIQGFGNLAKACILGLDKAETTISAIADAEKCYIADQGSQLPLPFLLGHEGTLLPALPPGTTGVSVLASEAIYSHNCDILVLAAVENVITADNAATVHAKAIVPGANLAITPEGEQVLYELGIIALPSFMAGCGGSLSMNGLFGPVKDPTPTEVLTYIEQSMRQMTENVLNRSASEKISPSAAALEICTAVVPTREKPYIV